MGRRATGGWAMAVLALLAGFSAPRIGFAGIAGSRHDFTGKAIAANGSCSVCHRLHDAPAGIGLWPRSLAEEAAYFDQIADPGYVPTPTLLCYDCHDDSGTALTPTVDNDPPKTTWSVGRQPQDVAFTDGPPAHGGTQVGYYELIDGSIPDIGNAAPIDGSPTGGHYWKSVPSGTPAWEQGDKLACSLCHDPHGAKTGSNEGFFLTATRDGSGGTVNLGDGLRASRNSRTGTGDGRTMCAACHGYTNTGTPVTLWGVTLPRPPDTVVEHHSVSAVACTLCHKHNKINTSCRECHGFPPLESSAEAGGLFDRTARPNAENYPDGAGAHRRHREALGEAIFTCEICHGPDPGSAVWHNQGNGTVTQTNVDIIGKKVYWDPTSTRAGGYDGNAGVANPDPNLWEFTAKAKAGGDQRCSSFACHGDPPNTDGALNWTDRMLDDTSGAFVGDGRLICAWCHDATPAAYTANGGASYTFAPNTMGNNATFGAEVNGHGLAAAARYDQAAVGDGLGPAGAAKDCAVCHDATYQAGLPRKAHFDGSYASAEKRLRGTINGRATADADAVCEACHQNTGAEAGSQVSDHGNSAAGGYSPLEGSFTRVCRQCHSVHGANWNGTGRNLYMVGAWLDLDHDGQTDAGEEARVDANAADAVTNITATDNPVILTSRTGANSFDPSSGTPSTHVCVTCHDPATGGGDHAGTTGYGSDERGNDCTRCHDHDYDNAAATPDGFMPSGCANSAAGCHGTTDVAPQPDGTTYPDRAGRHAPHIARIAAVNGLSVANQSTCGWCHPGGTHSGDQSAPPADLMNGSATHFKTINDLTDGGETVTQAGGNVTCAGVNCHYNTTTTPADWYGAATPGCAYCHTDQAAYTPGRLPNAHDRHVLPSASEGYAYACTACHPASGYQASHQNGTADVGFTLPWGADGDEGATGAGGAVKYGTGTAGDYYGCVGISCHGDYAGGTTTNAPNWHNTDAAAGAGNGDGRCGTCHGTEATQDPMPSYPDGAPKANKHPLHVTTNLYGCRLCHYTVTSDGATVTDRANHAEGTLWDVAADPGAPALYQFTWNPGSPGTCSAAACHGGNGGIAWSNTVFSCNACHGYEGGAPTNADVSDFVWAGGVPAMSKISYGEYTAADGGGHGSNVPRAINLSCNTASCHDSTAPHDTTTDLSGPNPFRLADQDGATGVQFGCDYAGSGCHLAGTIGPRTGVDIATITTHSPAAMSAAGYATKRSWPGWDPQCTNCHDPHGDGNLSMIARATYDAEPFNLPAGPPPAFPPEQTSLVFTDDTTGADATGSSYANRGSPYSSICQECHEDSSVVSFHDGPAWGTAALSNHPGTGTNPGDCSICHRHNTGFRPLDCEGCHNGNPSYPLAPNVIDGPLPSNTFLNYNWYGTDSFKQDGGHGDPQGRGGAAAASACADCHDLFQPPGNLHMNGAYESLWNNSTRNTNTAHLKAEFFTKFPANGPGTWSIQVAFDNYCYRQCHTVYNVPEMTHERDARLPSDPNDNASEFGYSDVIVNGDALLMGKNYPVDRDLNTNATGFPYYATCVTCHDPHGTTLTEPARTSNRMMRDKWTGPPPICIVCHK